MADIKKKRAKMMDYLKNFYMRLDPTGDNWKIQRDKFEPMSDAQFEKWWDNFFKNPKANLYLEIVEYERDLKIENIEKCADWMKVPLFERVAMPYLTNDLDNVIVTPTPVPVGYIHEKRMPQTVMKKSAGSLDISKRNPVTGQVTGEDKNARQSDQEVYSLVALNAMAALKEFMGPRADDAVARDQMANEIAKNGYVSLDDLSDDPYDKVALNTFNMYFLMMGFSTNLITPLGELPPTEKPRIPQST